MQDNTPSSTEMADFLEEDYEEIDEFISCLQEQLKTRPDSTDVMTFNQEKIDLMRFSAAAITRVLRETGCKAKIKCSQSEVIPSMGSVDVEGVSINIMDMEWFSRACEFASNTEIYPLKDNKVRLSLTFHGILSKIS